MIPKIHMQGMLLKEYQTVPELKRLKKLNNEQK